MGSHRSPVHAVAITPSGEEAVTTGSDNLIRRWRLPLAGDPPDVLYAGNHVYDLAFRPNSERLVTGGWPMGGTTVEWDTATGTRLPMKLQHNGRVYGLDVSADGNLVASTNLEGGCVDVWNENRERVREIPIASARVHFHPLRPLIALSGSQTGGGVFDLQTDKLIFPVAGRLQFSPDGKLLVAAAEGRLRAWDVASMQEVELGVPPDVSIPRFSPDGRLLALHTSSSAFLVWDLRRREVLFEADGHFSGVADFTFAPDGKTLASAGNDGRVLLWDLKTGRLKGELTGHSAEVKAIAFNSYGTVLASSGVDRTIRLWRAMPAGTPFSSEQVTPAEPQQLDPGNSPPTSVRSEFAQRAAELSSVVGEHANDWLTWERRGSFYRSHRRWNEAADDFRQAIALHPQVGSHTRLLSRAAVVFLLAERPEDYRTACRHLFAAYPDQELPLEVVRIGCLSAASGLDIEAQIVRVREVMKTGSKDHWSHCLALLLFRQGQFAEALSTATAAANEDSAAHRSGMHALVTALLQRELSQKADAKHNEKRASTAYLSAWTRIVSDDNVLLELEILGAEAVERRRLRLAENPSISEVVGVYRQSAGMTPEERYRYLASWVLRTAEPRQHGGHVRMYADVTTSDPPGPESEFPPIDREQLELRDPTGTGRRLLIGGNWICPGVELIRTAQQLNRVEELYESVLSISAQTDAAHINRRALLTCLQVARADFDAANSTLRELFPATGRFFDLNARDRWAILVALDQAVMAEETRPTASMMIEHLWVSLRRKHFHHPWHAYLPPLLSNSRLLLEGKFPAAGLGTPPPLKHWQPHAAGGYQISSAAGHPTWHWHLSDAGEVIHDAGHEADMLYFDTPLTGDFTVDCELCTDHWEGGRIAYAARSAFFVGDGKLLDINDVGPSFSKRIELNPTLPTNAWFPFRLEVKDGVVRRWINERLVDEEHLEGPPDPWLGFLTANFSYGAFRNLRISGHPTVPRAIRLSDGDTLRGWKTRGFGESLSGDSADWTKDGEEILGRMRAVRNHTLPEGCLQYHRPLMDDGRIEYEFFYEAGKAIVHPALGRLAFLLKADGVAMHWITNRDWEDQGFAPDNEFAEPENRRGPSPLPLVAGWNNLQVRVKGDVVRLALNGEQIYERPIERTNSRTFGLFHYRDRSECRVRNVVYRGAWPASLTDEARSELAVDPADRVVSGLQLTGTEETIDFTAPIESLNKRLRGLRQEGAAQVPAGVKLSHPPGTSHRGFAVKVPVDIEGDFQVELEFQDLDLPPPAPMRESKFFVLLDMDDAFAQRFALQRQRQRANVFRAHDNLGGDPLREFRFYVPRGTGGKFQMLRRGSRVHFLRQPPDSQSWEHITSYILFSPQSKAKELTFGVSATGDGGSSHVVLTKLTIRD